MLITQKGRWEILSCGKYAISCWEAWPKLGAGPGTDEALCLPLCLVTWCLPWFPSFWYFGNRASPHSFAWSGALDVAQISLKLIFSCLSLPRAVVKGTHHHARPFIFQLSFFQYISTCNFIWLGNIHPESPVSVLLVTFTISQDRRGGALLNKQSPKVFSYFESITFIYRSADPKTSRKNLHLQLLFQKDTVCSHELTVHKVNKLKN